MRYFLHNFLHNLLMATFAMLLLLAQVAHAKTTAPSGYVGDFMPLETDKGSSANNKITIFISKLDDKSIEG